MPLLTFIYFSSLLSPYSIHLSLWVSLCRNSISTSSGFNDINWKVPHPENQKLHLIGFSKGCVVLNQLLHELHFHKSASPQVPDVLKRVVSMTWLDGGHAGGKDTWVVQRQVLQTFAQTGVTHSFNTSVQGVHLVDTSLIFVEGFTCCFQLSTFISTTTCFSFFFLFFIFNTRSCFIVELTKHGRYDRTCDVDHAHGK